MGSMLAWIHTTLLNMVEACEHSEGASTRTGTLLANYVILIPPV